MSGKPAFNTTHQHRGLPDSAPVPRFCRLKKNYPEQEYGFDLHAEKLRGQFIGNVEDGSPAWQAGLRRGDRIVAVNGFSVINETHKDVVRRIREDPLQCRFVVIDEDGYQWYTSRKLSFPIIEHEEESTKPPLLKKEAVAEPSANYIGGGGHVHCAAGHTLKYDSNGGLNEDQTATTDSDDSSRDAAATINRLSLGDRGGGAGGRDEIAAHLVTCPPKYEETSNTFVCPSNDSKEPAKDDVRKEKPRLCKLQKENESAEYGFNLHAEKNKGHFIGKVDAGSIADRAGLVQGYRIVGVNGTLIYPTTPHKDVVALIKQDSLKTDLLISSPELDAYNSERKIPFSFNDVEIFVIRHEAEHLTTTHHVHASPPLQRKISNQNATANLNMNPHYGAYQNNGSLTDEVDSSGFILRDQAQELESNHCRPENGFNEAQTESADSVCNGHDRNGDAKHDKPESPEAQFFHMSASEMREYLSRHKKADPRRDPIPLREKYDIVQNL